jgi:hippurate hydrolase
MTMTSRYDPTRLLAEARELLPRAVDLRRRIHRKPELGLHLPITTAAVEDSLKGLDVEIARGTSTSGLMVSLTGGRKGSQSGKCILLRGDMDALPMPEDTGLDFASEIPDRMHACGHDSHTAMLVEAVHLLDRHRDDLAGTVKFMFQPGEEGYHGAKFMIEDGLLDADPVPDAAFALHILPHFPADTINGRGGAIMASADWWEMSVKGQGGHASSPELAIDPIPVAFEIGLALQTMVTRRISVFDPVVITVTQVTSGTTNNVIPETAHLVGTVRATSPAARETAQEGIRRIAQNIAAAHLCSAEVTIHAGYPVTMNDPEMVGLARDVARELGGDEAFRLMAAPVMGAEDFSYVLQRVPGCIVFLGVMPEGRRRQDQIATVHSNRMILNENSMAMGIAMHAAMATRYLAA